MKPVQSAVKNVAKKSTGTRPFQSTSNTITESGEECETTEQPSCSHRGGPRNVHEETFKIQIDDEWEILLECHNRRPGRPRKVIEETPNFQNDDERKILLECHNRPRGRPRKVLEETSNTGKEHGKQQQSQNCRRGRSKKFLEEMSSDVTNDVEEEQSEPDSDMMVVEEETDKEHETRSRSQHCCRGRSRKFLEGTSSRKEDQETLLQSQHCHVGLSRKVLEGLFNEMTLENNTSVPVSPRKCVAKKSTGTRAIQSKSQQQEKFQDKKKKTASLPVTEPQNEQNESDVDMVASDAEDVTNDVEEEQSEPDSDMMVIEEEEMTLENDKNVPVPSRKIVAKKSTGTGAIQSKSKQNDDKQEIPLESHPRHRTRPRKVFEKLSNDITNDVKEEQAESDVDILIAEEEIRKFREVQLQHQHRNRRHPKKIPKEMSSSDEDGETLHQSQHHHPQRPRKFLETFSSSDEDGEMLQQSQHHLPQRPRKFLERLSSEESQDKNKITSFPATNKEQECTFVFDSVTIDSYDDTMTSDVEEMNLKTDTNISVSPRKSVAKKSTGTHAPRSKTQQEEESSHRNRKYPVRSRKKTQEKRVYDEESDEESPDRNRKKSARSPRKTQKNHVDSDQDYEEADEESPDRNRKKSARSPRKTRKNHADSDQDYEEADEEGPSTSQIRSRNIGETDIETLVHKCVYYLLIADQKKHAIKKTDIMKHVIKGPQQLYSDVIDGANEVLKKTYGMEITQLRKGNLMLINNLTQELDVQQYSCLSGVKKQQQGLILYLLLIIYMNENSISESDLWNALVPLGIKPSTQKSHPIFGDVQKYINSELVKQMYIDHVCISKDPLHYEYRWGPRAESEVDKSDLLQFACLVLDKKPEDWILQYKDATESAETQDSVENS